MQWKDDPAVEAARQLPGWSDFHRACARELLFFDHIEKVGRSYVCTAFSGSGYNTHRLCEGSGKTVLEALEDAFQKSRWSIAEAELCLARMKGPPPIDYEELLG